MSFAVVLALVVPAEQVVERQTVARLREDVRLTLALYAHSISVKLDGPLEIANAVAAWAESQQSLAEIDREFPGFAARLITDSTVVRSIELQRAGVITWVEPAARNSEVLHRDIRTLFGAEVIAQVESTRARRRVAITGPTPSQSGGVGIVARRGIVSRVAGAPDLVSVVVHLDALFERAGADTRLDALVLTVFDKRGAVVSPANHVPRADAVRAEIPVADGSWAISAVPRGGWNAAARSQLLPIRVASVMILVLLTLVVVGVVMGRRRLEALVQSRTGELRGALERLRQEMEERERIERQLRGQEEQLAQHSKLEALGTMAGGLAHDFNNVLTVIASFTESAQDRIVQSGSVPAGTRKGVDEDLTEVRRATQEASAITGELLAFSRKQAVEPSALDLSEVVPSMHALLKRALGVSCELHLTIPAGRTVVHAERGQLLQILMNLVVNARDAMPGGGRCGIEVRASPLGGELLVSDSGAGMTDEIRARIFEPFYTTKSAGRGTGLGLSTVASIVQRLGGSIEVSSTVGVGTEFRVRLPAPAERTAA